MANNIFTFLFYLHFWCTHFTKLFRKRTIRNILLALKIITNYCKQNAKQIFKFNWNFNKIIINNRSMKKVWLCVCEISLISLFTYETAISVEWISTGLVVCVCIVIKFHGWDGAITVFPDAYNTAYSDSLEWFLCMYAPSHCSPLTLSLSLFATVHTALQQTVFY